MSSKNSFRLPARSPRSFGWDAVAPKCALVLCERYRHVPMLRPADDRRLSNINKLKPSKMAKNDTFRRIYRLFADHSFVESAALTG